MNKPCPFCGGELQVWERSGSWEVMCVGEVWCFLSHTINGCMSGTFRTEEEALTAWNRRTN